MLLPKFTVNFGLFNKGKKDQTSKKEKEESLSELQKHLSILSEDLESKKSFI